jgi:hypothetical protein
MKNNHFHCYYSCKTQVNLWPVQCTSIKCCSIILGKSVIHQMDEKLKIEFQLVEQRLGHHRQTLTTLMRSIKKAPVSQ